MTGKIYLKLYLNTTREKENERPSCPHHHREHGDGRDGFENAPAVNAADAAHGCSPPAT
jgi:hypothetical protein